MGSRVPVLGYGFSRARIDLTSKRLLQPDEWTDGTASACRAEPTAGWKVFRFYCGDHESRSRGKRSDEQVAYFGLNANTGNYQYLATALIARSFLQVEEYILQSAGRRQPNLK